MLADALLTARAVGRAAAIVAAVGFAWTAAAKGTPGGTAVGFGGEAGAGVAAEGVAVGRVESVCHFTIELIQIMKSNEIRSEIQIQDK